MRVYRNNPRRFCKNANANANVYGNKNLKKRNPNVHYISMSTQSDNVIRCPSSCRCDKCAPTFRPNHYNNYTQCVTPYNYIIREPSHVNNYCTSHTKCKRGPPGPPGPSGILECVPPIGTDTIIDCFTDSVLIQRENDDGTCETLRAPIDTICGCCNGGGGGGCETLWAMDPDTAEDKATCFLEIDCIKNNRWGWSNGPYMLSDFEEAGITLELWRGAGQCDLSKGDLVGSVQITKMDEDTLHFDITMDIEWCLCGDVVATYVGNEQVPVMPMSGNCTVAPGLLPCKEGIDFMNCQTLEFDCDILDIGGMTGDIYILLHAGARRIDGPEEEE